MLSDEHLIECIPTVEVTKGKPPVRMVWMQQRHALQMGRAVEAEVRKQDTELIRQLVEALEHHVFLTRPITESQDALAAGRARLQGEP